MNHHLQITLDPQLKGNESRCSPLPLKNNMIIQVKQHSNSIFTTYIQDPTITNHQIFLSARLCELNNIGEGQAIVEPIFHDHECSEVVAKVNCLDWEIINKNRLKLENEFLNQIKLVWDGAYLPLYYTPSSYVTLRISCGNRVGKLRENTAVQITQESKPASTDQQEFTNCPLEEVHSVDFGHINTVILPQSFKDHYSLTFSVLIEKTGVKSVLEAIKSQPRLSQLPLKLLKNQDKYSINNLLLASKKTNLSNCFVKKSKTRNSQEIDIQFLARNNKMFEIILRGINLRQRKELKTKFIRQFINRVKTDGFIDLFNNIPFVFENECFFLSTAKGGKPINHLKINWTNAEETNLESKFQQIFKISELEEQEPKQELISLRNLIHKRKNDFAIMFKAAYQEQMEKIIKNLKDPQGKNIVVKSMSNNGKSEIIQILALEGIICKHIDMKEIDDVSLNSSDICIYLETIFQSLSPKSIIFIDNLDSVCYKVDQMDAHRRQERISSKIILRMLSLLMTLYHPKCIISVQKQTQLDDQFLLSQFVNVTLKNPDYEKRMNILQNCKEKLNFKQEESEFIKESESMSFGEFYKYFQTGKKKNNHSAKDKQRQNFSKLAGLKTTKRLIRDLIQKPIKYSEIYKSIPIKLSKGALLYGGTGCGKTALGLALEDQFKMKFFTIKGSDILSKYIGGSEAAIRQIFQKAMSVSPSIIFFDEFQTIVPRRNSGNTGVTDRIVNQFLCYLDGVASMEGVFIVAASSRPDLIDPAILRPGRIDIHIYLEYPSNQERQQLFNLFSKAVSVDLEMNELLSSTENFSYSDLVGLLKQLRIKRSKEVMEKNLELDKVKKIDKQLWYEVIKEFKTAVNEKQLKNQMKLYKNFKNKEVMDIKNQKTVLQ